MYQHKWDLTLLNAVSAYFDIEQGVFVQVLHGATNIALLSP